MLYKFYLDGILVENPVGWDKMITSIKRDKELKGLFLTMDVTFTFTSSGYTYLKNKFDSEGYCSETTVKIEQSVDEGNNYINFYDGIIKISDVEFMLRQDNLEEDIIVRQYAKTKVLDNSFFSKIFNNRSLKTNICAGKSKNNLDITPCTVQYLRMFDPATGIVVGLDQQEAIIWFDVFRYLIEFMTDAEVTFDSNLFGVGGEYDGPVLSYGLPIFNQGGGIVLSQTDFIANLPQLSFLDFFREINVRLNLGMYIDNSGTKPKVKIEKWNDLFKTDSSVQVNNINSIITRISVDDIFSKLKLGTTETKESLGALNFPETINYIGFKEEEYLILGKCNIDRELDLTGEFITSSNVIEEILINNPAGTATPNTSYNKKFFLIDSDTFGGGLYIARATNWLDPTSGIRYYNERFTNSSVANNYLKAVPNDIAAYLGGTLDASFLATRTYDTQGVDVVLPNTYSTDWEFDNDSVPPAFDTSGVYNTVTNEFQVPTLGAGVYSFYASLNNYFNFQLKAPTGSHLTAQLRTQLYFDRYDSFAVLQASYKATDIIQSFNYNGTGNTFYYSFAFNLQGSVTINLNDGDIIKVRYFNYTPTFPGSLVVYLYQIWKRHDSRFACTGNTTGGGNYQTYDPAEYPIITDTFTQELTKTKFDLIAASPLSLIEFSQGNRSFKKGWIDELRYDHLKGVAEFTMLSAKNTN